MDTNQIMKDAYEAGEVISKFAELCLAVTMPDGSVRAVPVSVIAEHRAKHYSRIFDGDVSRSLREDTLPLFDVYGEIAGWAQNNMDWIDVQPHAYVRRMPKVDYQEGWVNGEAKVLFDCHQPLSRVNHPS